jgi:hypothetical protein
MRTGWTNEAPDAEGPAQPGGFAGFLSACRPDPAEGRTLEAVLARAHRDRDPGPEPRDQDEQMANLMARGYAPGRLSQLSARLAEAQAQLAAEREKVEADAKWNERVRRAHASGQMAAADIARSWAARDEGDPAKVEQLERRAASLERQLADAVAVIAPRQEPADPLEAATRRAHEAFTQLTRQKMADAAAGRPAARPFASGSRGGLAVRAEAVTCDACAAIGASPWESWQIHHSDADGQPVSGVAAELPSGQEAGRGERPDEYEREVARLVDAGYSPATARLGATPMIYR